MFDFLRYKKVFFSISAFVIGVGLLSALIWGFRYSIDFVGGTNLEYRFSQPVQEADLRKVFDEQKIEVTDVRQNENTFIVRAKPIDEKQEAALRIALTSGLKAEITPLRSETVGPVIGKETIQKTSVAAAIAVIGILLYIAYAFRNFSFAFAAIAALFHDVLVVIGSYSLLSYFLGAELDTLFVTALLTTMSFSVHDTIVVFDKIREYIRKYGRQDIEAYANRALTETMVRSLNNSMTIIFMLLALVLLGGPSIKFFALTLLIGTITGTYSSPFIATPIAVWLEKRKK